MPKLKIVKLDWSTAQSYHGTCLEFCAGFVTDESDNYFGYLGEYFKGIVVPDIEAYDRNYELCLADLKKEPRDADSFLKYINKNSPYDKGLCSVQNVQGSDSIRMFKDRPGYFEFSQFVADCPITRACIKQLETMKAEIESGICQFGDYPDQAGCFRSGDVFLDFVGILECLDRFWD